MTKVFSKFILFPVYINCQILRLELNDFYCKSMIKICSCTERYENNSYEDVLKASLNNEMRVYLLEHTLPVRIKHETQPKKNRNSKSQPWNIEDFITISLEASEYPQSTRPNTTSLWLTDNSRAGKLSDGGGIRRKAYCWFSHPLQMTRRQKWGHFGSHSRYEKVLVKLSLAQLGAYWSEKIEVWLQFPH